MKKFVSRSVLLATGGGGGEGEGGTTWSVLLLLILPGQTKHALEMNYGEGPRLPSICMTYMEQTTLKATIYSGGSFFFRGGQFFLQLPPQLESLAFVLPPPVRVGFQFSFCTFYQPLLFLFPFTYVVSHTFRQFKINRPHFLQVSVSRTIKWSIGALSFIIYNGVAY